MRGDKTENKPCAAGALQRGTHSKCHAQLEATSDIIICFFFLSHQDKGDQISDMKADGVTQNKLFMLLKLFEFHANP